MFEMMVGESPFPGDDEEEIFDAILNNEVNYPYWLSIDATSVIRRVRRSAYNLLHFCFCMLIACCCCCWEYLFYYFFFFLTFSFIDFLLLCFLFFFFSFSWQLLVKDPEKRLGGTKNDAKDIKIHTFFKDINWAKLLAKEIPPPFTPKIVSNIGCLNIYYFYLYIYI